MSDGMNVLNLFVITELAGQNFPMQVLSLNSSGTSYFGSNTEINQQLSVGRDAGPIVVDAIDRKAIWYERNLNLLNIQSLGIGGNVQVRESRIDISSLNMLICVFGGGRGGKYFAFIICN